MTPDHQATLRHKIADIIKKPDDDYRETALSLLTPETRQFVDVASWAAEQYADTIATVRTRDIMQAIAPIIREAERVAQIRILDSIVYKEVDVSDVERFEYRNDGMPMLAVEPEDIRVIISDLKKQPPKEDTDHESK